MYRISTEAQPITRSDAEAFFNWEPVEAQLTATIPGTPDIPERVEITESGVTTTPAIPGTPAVTIPASNYKAIVRPPGSFSTQDPGAVLGVPKPGFRIHPYRSTLVNAVHDLYDTDELMVNTMGYLDDGGIAWAQWRTPAPIDPAGTGYHLCPFISLSTSVNGKLATTVGLGSIVIVCSNTLGAFNREARDSGRVYRRRHTSGSLTGDGNDPANNGTILQDVRAALQIVRAQTDLTVAAIDRLANTSVTSGQWDAFLEAHAPTMSTTTSTGTGTTPTPTPTMKTGRALTIARNEQQALDSLYTTDARVTPWAGTALGVLQAVNTHETWDTTVRSSTTRDLRNADRMVRNEWAALDAATLAELDRVLDTQLAQLVAV